MWRRVGQWCPASSGLGRRPDVPKRSAVKSLPKAVRDWLEAALVREQFGGYEALAAELKSRGYEISKSSLHRHGQQIEKRLAAIRTSTEAAKLIVASTADAEDARSEALISLTQHELFEALVNLKDADETGDPKGRVALLAKAGRGIADVVRASVSQKKFSSQVRAQAQKEAAEAVDAVAAAPSSGLSAETANKIKAAILGVGA